MSGNKAVPGKKAFPLAILALGGVAWLFKRKNQELPGLPTWRRVLASTHGADKAQQMAAEVRRRYHRMLAERPLPDNPILRRHATNQILPGLALYQVLLEEQDGDRTAALAEIDAAFRASMIAGNRWQFALLRLLPTPSWLFRSVFNWRMREFPGEGWDFEYIANSQNTIAFNATRCFYLNTLASYGAPELTASFCKSDDVLAELFPPSIRFSRPHTLGRGDAVCDFQYCLEATSKNQEIILK